MKTYNFDKEKYITKGINETLPAELSIYLWTLIENLKVDDITHATMLMEYELREIFDYEGWKDVKRPQALGRQVSSLVDEGRLKNI